MSVGEASLEAAEAAAKKVAAVELAATHKAILCRMMLETMAEIQKWIRGSKSMELAEFEAYLEGETRLCESSETFAGIVMGLCVTEIVERFLRSHGVDDGGARA